MRRYLTEQDLAPTSNSEPTSSSALQFASNLRQRRSKVRDYTHSAISRLTLLHLLGPRSTQPFDLNPDGRIEHQPPRSRRCHCFQGGFRCIGVLRRANIHKASGGVVRLLVLTAGQLWWFLNAAGPALRHTVSLRSQSGFMTHHMCSETLKRNTLLLFFRCFCCCCRLVPASVKA
jgi:hypothetical protein